MKVGVMYVAPGQNDQYTILQNDGGSEDYLQFLESLGWPVRCVFYLHSLFCFFYILAFVFPTSHLLLCLTVCTCVCCCDRLSWRHTPDSAAVLIVTAALALSLRTLRQRRAKLCSMYQHSCQTTQRTRSRYCLFLFLRLFLFVAFLMFDLTCCVCV